MAHAPNTMKHPERLLVPPFMARAMFALMALVVALVAFSTLTGREKVAQVAPSPVVQSLDIIMIGDRAGTYRVTDLDGQVLAYSSDHMDGFLGVIGRVTDRARNLRNVPLDTPMQVVRRENGNIAILDESTGMATELIGYGADNVASFARLLD
jgi:putative photosynthetic complex assembly protein